MKRTLKILLILTIISRYSLPSLPREKIKAFMARTTA